MFLPFAGGASRQIDKLWQAVADWILTNSNYFVFLFSLQTKWNVKSF
jgi:hypothetical protein